MPFRVVRAFRGPRIHDHERREEHEKGSKERLPKATGYKLGLLVNFSHHPKLEYERIVR